MKQKTFDGEMNEMFGGKVYRLSLSSGCSCPNRDGRVSTGGCIFCSAGGSGEFASDALLSIDEQISEAKKKVARKLSGNFAGYMAYFQSFTNTYGPTEYLRGLFSQAMDHPDVLALSVATRPDCLPDEMVAMLAELNRRKPVWVELGLQTMHDKTAELINRGYALPVFEDAVRRLKAAGLRVVVHVIIGLPGEGNEEVKDTVRYLAGLEFPGMAGPLYAAQSGMMSDDRKSGTVFDTQKPETASSDRKSMAVSYNIYENDRIIFDNYNYFDYNRIYSKEALSLLTAEGNVPDGVRRDGVSCRKKETSPLTTCRHIDGIKLQVLQVLKGTKLAEMRMNQPPADSSACSGMKMQDPGILHEYTLEEYAALLKELLDILPEDVTVHRLTGDPPKKLLISPLWTADKKKVLNTIRRVLQ